eukprot:scaffold117344_cov31-Tisochrysis_lutea.AAC.1
MSMNDPPRKARCHAARLKTFFMWPKCAFVRRQGTVPHPYPYLIDLGTVPHQSPIAISHRLYIWAELLAPHSNRQFSDTSQK